MRGARGGKRLLAGSQPLAGLDWRDGVGPALRKALLRALVRTISPDQNKPTNKPHARTGLRGHGDVMGTRTPNPAGRKANKQAGAICRLLTGQRYRGEEDIYTEWGRPGPRDADGPVEAGAFHCGCGARQCGCPRGCALGATSGKSRRPFIHTGLLTDGRGTRGGDKTERIPSWG